MRCECCDKALTDYESSLKLVRTDDYANMCRQCLSGLGIPVKGNYLLLGSKNVEVDPVEEEVKEYLQLDHLIDEDDDE